MCMYSFDCEIAKLYGVDEAIILSNIHFWISKNEANKVNKHDGNTWTYNSMDAWHDLFPFWSKSQIRRKLDKLHEKGLILKGNYNKSAYDRTTWYSLTELGYSIFRNRQIENKESSNQTDGIVTPIPDSKPDSKPDRPSHTPSSRFDEFWAAYPNKTGKKKCQQKWKTRKLDTLADLIIADVKRRRIDDVNWQDGYIPNPETYINGDRWQDEIKTTRANNRPLRQQAELPVHYGKQC